MPDPRPFWLRYRQDSKDSWEILHDHEVDRTPPVDIFDLARALQIAVRVVKEPGWEGAVRFSATQAEIWVREESPLQRSRFTVAYELGRIFRNPFGEYRDAAPGMSDGALASEAKTFALCVLMPKVMIFPIVYETKMKMAEMAKLFDVPVNAMAMRVQGMLDGKEEL